MIQKKNKCRWLMIGCTTPCNKACVNEFCGYHMQSIRRGSLGPKPCLRCGVGVRGETQLCAARVQRGGKKYRELKRYYGKKNNAMTSSGESPIKTADDYLARFSK